MECPKCGLTNPHDGILCDCGYEFLKSAVDKPLQKNPTINNGIRYALLGLILAVNFLVIHKVMKTNFDDFTIIPPNDNYIEELIGSKKLVKEAIMVHQHKAKDRVKMFYALSSLKLSGMLIVDIIIISFLIIITRRRNT